MNNNKGMLSEDQIENTFKAITQFKVIIMDLILLKVQKAQQV